MEGLSTMTQNVPALENSPVSICAKSVGTKGPCQNPMKCHNNTSRLKVWRSSTTPYRPERSFENAQLPFLLFERASRKAQGEPCIWFFDVFRKSVAVLQAHLLPDRTCLMAWVCILAVASISLHFCAVWAVISPFLC